MSALAVTPPSLSQPLSYAALLKLGAAPADRREERPAEVPGMNLSDDCDSRAAMLRLRQAIDTQDHRAIGREAQALRRLYDKCRDGWDDQGARNVAALLDEADAFGWCVGFQQECPEVRGLLDVITNEGCRVNLGGCVVQLVESPSGASRVAQQAAGKLALHSQEHAAEVWWMVTGRLPGA